MAPGSDITHRVRDDKFEVGEASLTLLVDSAVRDARRERLPMRIAQVAGGTFLSLLASVVTATSFKPVLGLTADQVGAILGTITVVAGLVTLVSGVAVIASLRRRAITPREIVASLKVANWTPNLLSERSLTATPKLATKPTVDAADSDIDLLLSALADSLGVTTVDRLQLRLSLDEKSTRDLLHRADVEGFVRLDGATVTITADGNSYRQARVAERARAHFLNSNLSDALPPADPSAV